MTDADRIRNLLGRYCELVDAGDWPGLGALFARGRLADEQGTEIAAGAAAVERFFARGTREHGGSPRTKHLVLNTVLEEPGNDGTVTARSSYVVLQAVAGLPLQPIITGRYVDRFAPGGGPEPGTSGGPDPGPPGRTGWHFTERRFAVDLVGDLSHHLRFTL